MNDIPRCFTSGFSHLYKFSEQIKLNPKIIISGTQHVHNEIAKLWLLQEKYNNNKKLVYCFSWRCTSEFVSFYVRL